LNISELEVEDLLKQLRYREPESDGEDYKGPEKEEESIEENLDKGTLRATRFSDSEPQSPEDVIKLHNIDTKVWKLSQYWSKQKADKWLISALFTRIRVETDLPSQKAIILEEIKTYLAENKEQPRWKPREKRSSRDHLYEISLPDVHYGKHAWAEEVGEDYDLKIAEARSAEAVDYLLNKVNVDLVERFLFPLGNDLFNVDNNNRTTTAGTPQDQTDTRVHKMVRTATRAIIKQVDILSSIAPVDIPIVVGNHDQLMAFMMGEILDAYYHLNPHVTVFNSASRRKYYQYYENGFQFTHGNEEPHKELGIIFAAEQKRLWADTTFRFCQLGHFHKEKKIEYLTQDSFQGFQIEILPSLSGPDAWHNSKGYISNKAAKAFLYHRKEGEVGSFKYTVIK
jgi:hypothetical protein